MHVELFPCWIDKLATVAIFVSKFFPISLEQIVMVVLGLTEVSSDLTDIFFLLPGKFNTSFSFHPLCHYFFDVKIELKVSVFSTRTQRFRVVVYLSARFTYDIQNKT